MEEYSPDQAVVRDLKRGNYIYTYTGTRFFAEDVRPEDIRIADIAHALAQQCRFNGHTPGFYSVAQHSVLVSQLVRGSQEEKLWGLLHDASEAYIPDVPRPFKPYLTGFKDLEATILRPIIERFGLTWPVPEKVHYIDSNIVAAEATRLWTPAPEWTQAFDHIELPRMFSLWDPEVAKINFLATFCNLALSTEDFHEARSVYIEESSKPYVYTPPMAAIGRIDA